MKTIRSVAAAVALAVIMSAGFAVSVMGKPLAVVNDRVELLEALLESAKTLKTSVSVVVPDYSKKDFDVDLYAYMPIVDYGFYVPQGQTKDVTVTYKLEYSLDQRVLCALTGGKVELTDKEKKLLAKVKDILKDIIKDGMSEYEKVVAVHDYIKNNVEYDYTLKVEDCRNSYGALMKGKAVCQGYSQSFRLLTLGAGVWCDKLIGVGTVGGDGYHEWNIVRIDGRYYHVDVTWDNPTLANGTKKMTYTYLNLTDEQMSADHNWDKALLKARFGAFTADDHNYLKREGFSAKTAEEFVALVVKFGKEGLATAEIALTDGLKVSDVNVADAMKSGAKLSGYYPNKLQNVITVIYKK